MMLKDIAQLLLTEIERQGASLLAIDGRCASGKTSLAAHLAGLRDCSVIHMDHFFLRPEQRTAERMQQAGGNVDYERFQAEVLLPLQKGQAFSYRPWDCHKQEMGAPVLIPPKALMIVEGSYSCHPVLNGYYDLSVFLSVDAAEQIRRIRQRNGADNVQMFQERWIPMEERYFQSFRIQETCDLRFQT